ncbi:glycosyltransferase [Phocaeicola sartorii]|jgi:glycosyltransferase involved in cell wall biosynthesis|uniref:Glycosyltransferase family 4 protein n=3 Tax=Phocaeicola sartorii TaxID=671267 RepID=R9I9S5_9BACT|nr:glycosyltransferase [Phocaeicola sartorii]EOS13699.1 hypothetical protein C802_01542 [Phocaeicola sartorii]MCR1843973.1 glycosyltransferase [Phocaeicola sartorii]NUL00378.1 glycosyltransferase [Phocaeicola sartorii]
MGYNIFMKIIAIIMSDNNLNYMNILFLMGEYPSFGGVEMVSTVLANKFISNGHNVTIASFKQSHPEFANKHLSNQCKLLSLSYPVLSLRNLNTLRKYIQIHHIDILINQWVVPFYTTLIWKYAVKGTNCKVFSVHHNKPDTNKRIQELDIIISQGKRYLKPLRWLVKEISRISLAFCINSSDKYIVLSPSFIPLAQRYTNIFKADKFLAIANPVTIQIPVSNSIIQNKGKEVIYVGRIEYNQKRTFRIIDIWKNIESKFPEWNLTIIGDGKDRNDLEKRIQENNLKNISITGFVNPITYYQRASILLMTSEYEGFPLVLAEGMTYGVVPIVYGSFDAVFDIIINDYNGYITKQPYHEQDFVHLLERLFFNTKTLQRLSQNAQLSAQQFSVDSIIEKWYKTIL